MNNTSNNKSKGVTFLNMVPKPPNQVLWIFLKATNTMFNSLIQASIISIRQCHFLLFSNFITYCKYPSIPKIDFHHKPHNSIPWKVNLHNTKRAIIKSSFTHITKRSFHLPHIYIDLNKPPCNYLLFMSLTRVDTALCNHSLMMPLRGKCAP